jgi:hypothetical protein
VSEKETKPMGSDQYNSHIRDNTPYSETSRPQLLFESFSVGVLPV